jgi:hypothetical protein
VSEYEKPGRRPTLEDLHQLMGASTPHFALQLRNRIRKLIAGLPDGDEVRVVGEREIARLERIAFDGEHRGHPGAPGEVEMPSIRRVG